MHPVPAIPINRAPSDFTRYLRLTPEEILDIDARRARARADALLLALQQQSERVMQAHRWHLSAEHLLPKLWALRRAFQEAAAAAWECEA